MPVKTVEHLFEETDLTLGELAQRAGLPVELKRLQAEEPWG